MMPRIYASNNDPVDFCRDCFPTEQEARRNSRLTRGTGPDGRGDCFEHDGHHPDYDGLDYHCEICDRVLTDEDNLPKT